MRKPRTQADPGYTTAEVASRTGVTSRQLDYWAWKHILVPSIHLGQGRGSQRLYSAEDLFQVQVICKLLRDGWSMQKIHKMIRNLSWVLGTEEPLKKAIIVANSQLILALFKTTEKQSMVLDALNKGGQGVMNLMLSVLLDKPAEQSPDALSKQTAIGRKISTRHPRSSRLRPEVVGVIETPEREHGDADSV